MDTYLCASATTRFVWAGDQLLWELKTPSEAATWETEGPAAAYGQVSYFHAGGIDRPLVITKGSESVIPHQNWRGQFARGTYADGRPSDCESSQTTGCTPIQWPGYRTTAWHVGAKEPSIQNWFGGLVDGMRDASGQMYMRNRYYDPATGQFTQPDPIGIAGGLNVYGFAAGDPVSYSDPYGLCPPKFLCDLIGATAGEEATNHWAEVANNSSGIRKAAATGAGLLSALWTPDTYLETGGTLLSGVTASRALMASRTAGTQGARRGATEVTEEVVERRAAGADGGRSRHVLEQVNGETNSVTHQVHRNGELIHQHQTHVGRHGTRRQFPDEWVNNPEVNKP